MSVPVLQPGEVQQLASLPEQWSRKRLRYLSARPIRNGLGEAANSDDPENPRYIRITDIGGPRLLRQDTFRSLPPELAKDAQLHQHDILISAVGATYGKSYYAMDLSGEACFAGYLVRLSPSQDVEPSFLAYWTESRDYWAQVDANVIQSTIQNFSAAKVRHLNAPVPPLDTQRRIARFLDEKTARIDGLIEKKRALLDRLAEKRQALITRAVTKGLDPAATMKPSGIDWLGEIPAHWEVLPLRRLARKVSTGRTPPSASIDYFTDGEVNWFTPGDFQTGIELHTSARKITSEALEDGVSTLFPEGTVFLVAIGATLGKVAVSMVEGSANQQINAILPEPGNDPHYLAYFLHGFREEVRVTSNGNTLGILNQEGTKSLSVLRPPSSEQREISSELKKHDRREGDVIEAIQRSILSLGEYRAALITAGVTGKIADLQ